MILSRCQRRKYDLVKMSGEKISQGVRGENMI